MSAARVRMLSAFLFVGLLAVLGRLVQLQLLDGEAYAQQASARVRRIELIEPLRGRLLDRKGRVLAEDILTHELWVDPSRARRLLEDREGLERLLTRLAASGFPEARSRLMEEAQRWESRWKGKRPPQEAEPRRWLSGLPEPAVYWIACRQDEYAGLSLERRAVRRYPHGPAAAHVLGHVGAMDPKDLERLRAEDGDLSRLMARYGRAEVLLDEQLRETAYFPDDIVGRRGMERVAETALRGRRGVRVVSVDVVGGRRREESQIEPARPGRDVHLTLDLDLQQAAERALSNRRGAVVAMDPSTGEVLAMASGPSYDPNLLRQEHARLLQDPGKPLLNRAVRGEYPPGSTFKLVTSAAALDAGFPPDERVHCEGAVHDHGARYGCNGVHGDVDFLAALEHSCNVYFFQMGRRTGSRTLAAAAERFGCGAATGLSLGGEELAGAVPTGDPLNMAVGQGRVLMTPLQGAVLASVLANGGRQVRPTLLPEGIAPPFGEPALSERALGLIREGMRRVVSTGSARHAGLAPHRVLGKTGTAQVGRTEREGGPPPHAWFVGYGPDGAPALAVAVIVEHGGAGGDAAAPVAEAVFRAWEARSSPPQPDVVG